MSKDFTLKQLLLSEKYARKICERFVYKTFRNNGFFKNYPTF